MRKCISAMNRHYISTAAALLLVWACSNCVHRPEATGCVDYTFQTLDSARIDTFGYPQINVEEMGIGMPVAMAMVGNNTIAVLDGRGEQQVKLISLDDGTCHSLVRVGEGPDEMLHVNTMSVRDSRIELAGDFDNKTGVIERESNGEYSFTPTGRKDNPFLRHIAISDNVSLFMPAVADSIRFVITDATTGKCDTIRKFPLDDPNANNAIFQADICLSSDGKSMMVINRSWGIAELYDTATFNQAAISQGPVKVTSKIEADETPFGTRLIQKPMHIVMAGLSAHDNGFYTGYIGACSDNPESMRHGISRLIGFDKDGMPQKYYVLPQEVITFTVTPDGKAMYGLMHDENGDLRLVTSPL